MKPHERALAAGILFEQIAQSGGSIREAIRTGDRSSVSATIPF